MDRAFLDRRHFALLSASAALLAGCREEPQPARDATLLHNRAVREAVSELEQAANGLDMSVDQFSAENWRDQLAAVQTATTRLRTAVDELKRSLGYPETP